MSELKRLRALAKRTGGSPKISDQIAELAREWESTPAVEAQLNEEEAVAKRTVANLRD